jgi:hypothetical protein
MMPATERSTPGQVIRAYGTRRAFNVLAFAILNRDRAAQGHVLRLLEVYDHATDAELERIAPLVDKTLVELAARARTRGTA